MTAKKKWSKLGSTKDYISGCVNFSFNCQSVSLLQAYLLLELSSSSLLAGTGGNRQRPAATSPLVFSGNRVDLGKVGHGLETFLLTSLVSIEYLVLDIPVHLVSVILILFPDQYLNLNKQ